MLYSMARRYDEWKTNDDQDEGSSLRGALKGWARHGASAGRLWTDYESPDATQRRRRLVARQREASARRLLPPDAEVADRHPGRADGIGRRLCQRAHARRVGRAVRQGRAAGAHRARPTIPVIECRPGEPDGGHAFAIVGYTDRGFVVQNSWGPDWGRGGFGILTYADWRAERHGLRGSMQLGVVTREHEQLRRRRACASSAGRRAGCVMSSSDTLAAHEISPFVDRHAERGPAQRPRPVPHLRRAT